jgi:hypothetical protein
MYKFVRWVTLVGAFFVVALTVGFYVSDPKSISEISQKDMYRIFLMVVVCIAGYQAATSLYRARQLRRIPKMPAANVASASISGRLDLLHQPSDPLKLALQRRPILTVILILFALSAPVLIQISATKTDGGRFSTDDWLAVVFEEALIVVACLYAWYRVKRPTSEGRHRNGAR